MSSMLSENEIRKHLKTELIGRKLYIFDEVDSTNNFAKRVNENGAVIIAKKQSRGRGRFSRRWESPEGGIYMSIIIFEEKQANASKAGKSGIIFSLACCKFLRSYGIKAGIKWPNDIVVLNRKIGGILIEAESLGERTKIVAGVGINANTSVSVDVPTTSMKSEIGKEVNINKAIAELLNEIEEYYKRSDSENLKNFIEEYKKLCTTTGMSVIIRTMNETLAGIAEDIGENGELVLRMHDGKIKKIISGDCLHLSEQSA